MLLFIVDCQVVLVACVAAAIYKAESVEIVDELCLPLPSFQNGL